MFTGLIEHVGTIRERTPSAGGGARLRVDLGPLAEDAAAGGSIAIDGCCLTLAALEGSLASFDAVPETLRRTTLGALKAGSRVNLERALLPGKRLGGHFVQGHVDGTASVKKTVRGGRWAEWHFTLDDAALAPLLVEKGSIALDGISLTVAGTGSEGGPGGFWVALIPETLQRTTIASKREGAKVNVETDILGKYVHALIQRPGGASAGGAAPAPQKLNEAWLREQGYG